MNERVNVTVNGRQVALFLGLTVRHAIGARATKAVQQGRAEVRNGAGNLVGLDGALYDGEELVVSYLPPPPVGTRRGVGMTGCL